MKIVDVYSLPQSAALRHAVRTTEKKRKILVIEDNELNREILSEILQDEYELICAENGEKGIQLLKKYREVLSLILLDVYMPVCDGFEFLRRTQKDPYLSVVPVIVTTSSDKPEDEEKCLHLGATDFITKPYNPEVIFGRIHNVIRLREMISTLSIVEFDKLTGLYTMSAFYHHAAQILRDNSQDYDLVMIDIQSFSVLNMIYGDKTGDHILKYIAEYLKKESPNALIARQEDNFYILWESESRMTRQKMVESYNDLISSGPVSGLRLRIGIYRTIDKNQAVPSLCDRVKMAAKSNNKSDDIVLTVYDNAMEMKRLQEQKLLLSFDDALSNGEFKVWFQPKVDPADGCIVGAEALVRWIDQDGKMISPGSFIPLFEREGKIQVLDEYMFRSVCKYQQERIARGVKTVPVSVNLSRNSLFIDNIADMYTEIADEQKVPLSLVPIEITESAATSSQQVENICSLLANAGFELHMDDFGTGYSSFSSLATLPFSILKIDKSLIDKIGLEKGEILIKNLINIAQDLGMKIVAEGVENPEQIEFLMRTGCSLIQGYFFSRPVNLKDFDAMLDAEDPFADKRVLYGNNRETVIRMTTSELTRYLHYCRQIFSAVRLLDEECLAYQTAEASGELLEKRTPCYELWKRNERCSNCISLEALRTGKTQHKFQDFEDKIYSIYAIYIEVAGKPHVVEMMRTVDNEELSLLTAT